MDNILKQGIDQNIISLDDEGKQITYNHQNITRQYSDPEEQVQALTFLKLIFDYGYPQKRIKQFLSVTMGSSIRQADIVIYHDDACSKPYIVVECKKEQISELEFDQTIKQAASYAYALAGEVKHIWITSGLKNEYFTIDKNSTIKEQIPDIPRYGQDKISPYKYAKGGKVKDEATAKNAINEQYFDLQVVNESDLTNRFRQAHQALWGGGELNPSTAFDELDKLIFCKIWDEKKPRKEGDPYRVSDICRRKSRATAI